MFSFQIICGEASEASRVQSCATRGQEQQQKGTDRSIA